MSLSSKTKNKLVDAVNVAFAAVGRSNGTKMPKAEGNREPLAYELWCAQHLASLATKRKEQAEAAAIAGGVIFDKEKNPKEGGTKEVIYNGEIVVVSVDVRNGATRVDAAAMATYLMEHNVAPLLVQEAMSYATKHNRPAHVFNSMLVTDEVSGK